MPIPMLYEILSANEKSWMYSGCGPKRGVEPDFIFREACSRHDFDYWRGFTERDRAAVDKRWLGSMLVAARLLSSGWWSRQWHVFLAWRYYLAARWLGRKAFSYRDHYGTREDLVKEMVETP